VKVCAAQNDHRNIAIEISNRMPLIFIITGYFIYVKARHVTYRIQLLFYRKSFSREMFRGSQYNIHVILKFNIKYMRLSNLIQKNIYDYLI